MTAEQAPFPATNENDCNFLLTQSNQTSPYAQKYTQKPLENLKNTIQND